MVIMGLSTSSDRYRRRREGRAMKIRVIVGRIVHTTSTSWPSVVNRLRRGDMDRIIIMYITTMVIIDRIIITWS
jgi:hypothetical protein